MNKTNQLARTVARFDALPAALRPAALSLLLGRVVPFTGTAGLQFELLTPRQVVVSIKGVGLSTRSSRPIICAMGTSTADSVHSYQRKRGSRRAR